MKSRLSLLIVLGTSLLFLFGCATPTQPSAMTVGAATLGKMHSQTASVQVDGGKPTNPAWTSSIANEDLLVAIRDSIANNRLFSAVVKVGSEDYALNATIVRVDQPVVGFGMTVGLEIYWTLTPKGATKPIWEKSIQSSGTKGVGDAFVGVTRLRMATEEAAKNNIAEAMTAIGALELK